MNIKLIPAIILFSCLCLLCVNRADAQTWQSLNGPPLVSTSQPNHVVIQGDTLFAVAGERAIFKKNIHSNQWIYAGTNKISSIKAFTLDEQGNYYAVDREVVFPTDPPFSIQNFSFSENYGQSWKSVENLFDRVINEIFIVESDEVLLGGSGIYLLSEDEDKESFNTVDSTFSVNTFYQHHDTLIAGGFNGIATSVDAGITWENIGSDTLQVQSVTSTGDLLLIASKNNIFLKENLIDDGELISNLPETTINVLHTTGNQVYAGTESGILLIDTESLTANPVFPELTDKKIFSIDSNSDILYSGTDAGFYRCMIATNSCEHDSSPSTLVGDINLWKDSFVLTADFHGVSKFSIDEAEWHTLGETFFGSPDLIYPKNDTSFFVGVSSWLYTCSFNTDNCSDSVRVDPGETLQHISENDDEILFLNTYKNVFQSNDGGSSWQKLYSKEQTGPNFGYIWKTFAYADSLLFIASTDSLTKYHLYDNTFRSVGFEGYWDYNFTFTDNGTLFMNANTEVYKSTDTGETWSKVLDDNSIDEDYGSINKLLYDNHENKLYAVFSNGSVYLSNDEGENWGVQNELFQTLQIEDAILDSEGSLYLASNGTGVFTNTQPLNPPITISNEEEPEVTVPDEFILNQNYPNPFNPSTTITYSLPEPTEVSLTVYNLVGQQVAVLLNGMQNRGVHSVEFDAGHLASGLYLYKLETGNYSETRKMMLVK